MSTTVERDERTIAVENASYRWAYQVMSFGLLAIVAYRGLVLGEDHWELLGLVLLGGIVPTAYQARHHVLGRSWMLLMVVTAVAALAIGAAIVFLRR